MILPKKNCKFTVSTKIWRNFSFVGLFATDWKFGLAEFWSFLSICSNHVIPLTCNYGELVTLTLLSRGTEEQSWNTNHQPSDLPVDYPGIPVVRSDSWFQKYVSHSKGGFLLCKEVVFVEGRLIDESIQIVGGCVKCCEPSTAMSSIAIHCLHRLCYFIRLCPLLYL